MNEKTPDIVREMREFADTDSQSMGRDVLRREIQHFADRIEAAHKREEADALDVGAFLGACESACEKSLQVGNGAKCREALEQVFYIVRVFDDIDEVRRRVKMVESSLDAPPRNCDKCKNANQAVALAIEAEVLNDDFDAWDMAEFLLAEAKGENK